MKSKMIFGLVFFMLIINNKVHSQKCDTYKVTEIDSTDNHYVISVKKEQKKYLIISRKRNAKRRDRIDVNKSYKFKLSENNWIKRFPPDLPNTLVIDGKSIWHSEDKFKVYTTKNLKGLKYSNRCGCPR